MTEHPRNWYYKTLPMLARRAGLDDAAYRAVLAEHGATEHQGRPSAATLSHAQLQAAHADLTKRARGKAAPWLDRVHKGRKGQWKMVMALWLELAEAGKVRDKRIKAMLAWCAPHITADRLEWAGAEDLNQCIEGLKAWTKR